jgi:hypothetical protein
MVAKIGSRMDAAADIANILFLAQERDKAGADTRLDAAYTSLRSMLASVYPDAFVASEHDGLASHKWSFEKALRRLGADRDPLILKLAATLLDVLDEQSSAGSSSPVGVAIRAVRARGATFNDVRAAGTGVSIRDSNFSEDLAFARIVAGRDLSPTGNRPAVHLERVTARDIQISFSERLWTRVRDFHASDERLSLMARRPKVGAPIEMGLLLACCLAPVGAYYWMGPAYFHWVRASLLHDISSDPRRMMISLIAFGGYGSIFLYGLYSTIAFYISPIARISTGIIGKDLVVRVKEKSPFVDYYAVSFIDEKNMRQTAKLRNSRRDLVSIGDIGLLAVRAGEVVDFFPSKDH